MAKITQNVREMVELEVLEMLPFQGKLKSLSPENAKKLKAEIMETGFNFSPHVWRDQEGKHWLLDGHQRRTALELLKVEGAEIPKIKCVLVHAPSYQAAKRMVLQGISQYGKVDTMELPDFAAQAGLSLAEIPVHFDLPNVDPKIFHASAPEQVPEPESREKDEPPPLKGGMKNIVLYFSEADYPRIVQLADNSAQAHGVGDFAELFKLLLEKDDCTREDD